MPEGSKSFIFSASAPILATRLGHQSQTWYLLGHELSKEFPAKEIEKFIKGIKRIPKQRNTLYGSVSEEVHLRGVHPFRLSPIRNNLEDRKNLITSSK